MKNLPDFENEDWNEERIYLQNSLIIAAIELVEHAGCGDITIPNGQGGVIILKSTQPAEHGVKVQ